MADAITIKALQDASLDAKSLEEVVNGDEAKQVTTRKGETYPSVKKAIKTLFENGGLPATPFATKALMTASSLADDKYAMVTDDTTNNGLYVKTAGAWVKSLYDTSAQSKVYAETLVNELYASVFGEGEVYGQDMFKNEGIYKVDGTIVKSGFTDWKHTNKIKVSKGDVVDVTTLINFSGYSWLAVFDVNGVFLTSKVTPSASGSLVTFKHTFLADGFFATQHSPEGVEGCSITLYKKRDIAFKEYVDNRVTPIEKIEGYIPSNNLFNPDTAERYFIITHTDGALKSNVSFPSIVASDFIPVDASTDYAINFNDTSAWAAEYDADKNFVSGHTGRRKYVISTSVNTAYIRYNINKDIIELTDVIVLKSSDFPTKSMLVKPTFEWVDSSVRDIIKDLNVRFPHSDDRFLSKKLLVTGDSITDDRNSHATTWWHGFLKSWLGMASVENDGASGSGIIKNTGINYRLPSWSRRFVMPDLILIMGNMNDGTSVETGDWSWIYGAEDAHKGDWDTVITTANMADSLWYSLRYMFEELLRLYPNTPIGFITSTPRSQIAEKTGVAREGYKDKCWGSDGWFAEWVEVIKLIANHYSIPVLDLYNQSNMRPWIAENNAEVFSKNDGIHPNTKGHELMAQKILEFTKQYM